MKKTMCSLLLFFATTASVSAFSPIAHMILVDSVAGRLPKGNIIKLCMEEYPEIARIGSVGPDLPASSVYLHGMSLLHYHKVGDFAKTLLKEALKPTLAPGFKSSDLSPAQKMYIAFAAGWISHIGGDFGSHQYFIYPMAGFYLSGNVSERTCHSEQEELADSWVYTNYAQYQKKYQTEFKHQNRKVFFNKIMKRLINKQSIGLLDTINKRIDHLVDSMEQAQKSDFMRVKQNAENLLHFGRAIKKLQPNFAFDTTPFYSCLTGKMENRNTLVKNAFEFGIDFTSAILIDASNNNYSKINNNWNLDVGPDNGNPTYTVIFKFNKTLFSGTRGKLTLVLQNKKNKTDTFELTEETLGYQVKHNDNGRILYELKTSGKRYFFHVFPEGAAGRGKTDNSYQEHCPDPTLYNYKLNDLESFSILFTRRGFFCDQRLVMEELELWQNGTPVYRRPVDKHLIMNRKKDSKTTGLIKVPH